MLTSHILYILACYLQIDPDLDPDPIFQFDAGQCRSGSKALLIGDHFLFVSKNCVKIRRQRS